MTDIRIVREELEGRRGRYVARIDGIDGEAEITFTRRGPALISADHTGAPETMKGTGAAAALVSFMVEDVRSQYRRHPDWADVMTLAPGQEP
jgi:predicted GNAT family acetyltransferase